MTDWVDVASAEELERDGRVIARLGGREIGVVGAPTGPRGVRNRCPHHGAPLCLGSVRERAVGVPGSYGLGGRTVLKCPWHGWEFDLETGRCPDDPSIRVAVYDARIVDGRVQVRA
jgi:nitrite reductase (NADH) small subunit